MIWVPDLCLWWPVADGDPHEGHRWVLNKLSDVDLTTRRCRQRRSVVQAGAHVGLWPLRLAKSFKRVFAFDLQPGLSEAAARNCLGHPNITISALGLSASAGTVEVAPQYRAGSWRVERGGSFLAPVTTIDSLGLDDCDAIILDVEGHEVEALRGAAETIRRCRPVIHLEQLDRSAAAIEAHMAGLRYRRAAAVHADVVYVPR